VILVTETEPFLQDPEIDFVAFESADAVSIWPRYRSRRSLGVIEECNGASVLNARLQKFL
jgi:hypothetical protein